MRQRVIHLMRPRAGLAAVVAMCWFWVVPVVDAATARAELKDARGTKVGGATLVDTPGGVKISARFTELPPGEHGFHVHAVGRCEPPFESAGGHFNPMSKQHGRDNPQGPHAGDLPNVQMSDRREGTIEIVLRRVSLNGGPTRLLDSDGASLVVHERADDYVTDPAGSAGARIACGVITGS